MTNEEAIHELECNVDYKTPQIAQACKLAARALEELRPKGKWIMENQTTARCSNCGYKKATKGADLTGKALIHYALFHYCEICGARMERDKE